MSKKAKLTHRIHTRITREKYEELSDLLRQSRGIQSLSELVRNILDNRKITVQTYDSSLDKVMETLSGIRTELHHIGININQITRRFHTEKMQETRPNRAMEIAKLYEQTGRKVTQLFALIEKLSEKWLPG